MERSINIFLVEDSEMYSLSLENSLKNIGNYRLNTYTTAEEALSHLYLNPDLIILDYFLPGLNGVAALKKFEEEKPGIPVIILSAQDEIQVVLDLLHAGAYDYIIKNKFTTDKLFHSIQRILSTNTIRFENTYLRAENKKFKIWFLLLAIFALAEMILFFMATRE